MIVFGGKEGDRGKRIINQLYVLDFKDNKWIKPDVKNRPDPRMGHIAVVYKDYMIINGGWSGKDVLKDTQVLDMSRGLDSFEWTTVDKIPKFNHTQSLNFDLGEPIEPPYRQFHSANIIGDKILQFGGGDGKEWLDDLLIFDITKNQWFQPKTKGQKPGGRLQHTSFIYKNRFYIFGGEP